MSVVVGRSAPQVIASPQAAAPSPPSEPSWRRFLDGCKADAVSMRQAARQLTTSVVVLGGTGTHGAHALARDLGARLGRGGLPLRTLEREGGSAALVASARAVNPAQRVEAINVGAPDLLGEVTRVRASTRELGKRVALENASAYVVLPGDLETLWELTGLWTLLKIWMIPSRPVILVGDEAQWRAVLDPFIDKSLAAGTIPKDAVKHLIFAPTAAKAAELAAQAHAKVKPEASTRLARLSAEIVHDVARAEQLMPKCAGPSVVYGGAALKPDSPAFQRIEAAAAELGGPWCTGLGYGAMLAALRGAKAADPNALNQGVAIRIRGEPHVNEFVDEGRYFVARVIEIRQRLLLDMGKRAHIVEDGGIGTLFELYQLLQLLADRELSDAPVMVSTYFKETLEGTARLLRAQGLDTAPLDRVRYYANKDELVTGLRGPTSA